MSAMTITNEVKRSWADIVTGSTSRPPPAPIVLEPAARGERRCLCQGEILVMLGHYGWIMAFGDIEHPDVDKTAGRIYLNKRDVVDGVSLMQGDVVSFYLYADDQGLGAERCSLEQSVQEDDCGQGSASPFPNWNTLARDFVPAAGTVTPSTFNVQATVFVPSYDSVMNVDAIEFVPATIYSNILVPKANFLAINPAFLSDDESDDESSTVSNDDFSGNEGDKEFNSDDESLSNMSVHSWQTDKEVEWNHCLDVVVLGAPLKTSRCSSDNDSTSAGAESNSDDEDSEMPWAKLSSRLATRLQSRLAAKLDMFSSSPLGLSLPAGFRPPPGLSLPACVA